MFKKFSFYLLTLLLPTITFCNRIPNKEIIILLENINYETIDKTLNAPNIYKYMEILHPVGIGATTISLLIALYQQAAPLIVNRSLIKNIIDHQNLFSDFLNLDRETLHNKYGKYDRFRGRLTLDKFRKNCQQRSHLLSEANKMLTNLIKDEHSDFDKIMNQITTNPNFQGDSLPEMQNGAENTPYMRSLNMEMRMFILCSWIDLDKDWEIKQVNDDIFLLIPKSYVKNLGANSAQKLPATAKKSCGKFTDLELNLGLKVDHIKTVKRNFFEQKFLFSNAAQISFAKSLEQIFLTANDLKAINSKKMLKYIWSIYMSGHGLNINPQLDILPQLYELKKLYKHKLKSLEPIKNGQRVIKKQVHNHQQEYIRKIRKLNDEIKKSEDLKSQNNKRDQAMINSLPINEFKNALKFFNDQIETSFLYYFSCFSAGPHLIEPYLENGKPLKLKYMVMTGTPAENPSVEELPFINMPPYFSEKHHPILFEPMNIGQIDIENKKLSLATPLKFGNFFKLLRNGVHNDLKNLVLLPYSLHPHVDQFGKIIPQRIANMPLVRLANTDHFQPIPNDSSCNILDLKNSSKPLAIDKQVALIYSDYVSGKLTLNSLGKEHGAPNLLSMIPGFALHVFEEVNSSTLSLKEIVNSFLTFPELGSSKIFWIKKLECKSDEIKINDSNGLKNTILDDVIIMRNVFNSDTLARCSQDSPLPLNNCAYVSTHDNKEAKLTWNGPFLDDSNYQLNISTQSDHKEECVNCFPKVITHLSPVLQSI